MVTMLSCFLEGDPFSLWSLSLGALAVVTTMVFLANTDLFLTKPGQTNEKQLGDTELKTTTGDRTTIQAQSLWEMNGAIVMAEAAELSSLKPQLDQLGVPLYAVVKEDVGTEVQDFRSYFSGEIFVDEKQGFYGPKKRRMGLGLGLARLGVLRSFVRAQKKGYQGNVKGEGYVLGGMFVIGAGKEGILMEHREKEFGDKADLSSVLEAAKTIHR